MRLKRVAAVVMRFELPLLALWAGLALSLSALTIRSPSMSGLSPLPTKILKMKLGAGISVRICFIGWPS